MGLKFGLMGQSGGGTTTKRQARPRVLCWQPRVGIRMVADGRVGRSAPPASRCGVASDGESVPLPALFQWWLGE